LAGKLADANLDLPATKRWELVSSLERWKMDAWLLWGWTTKQPRRDSGLQPATPAGFCLKIKMFLKGGWVSEARQECRSLSPRKDTRANQT